MTIIYIIIIYTHIYTYIYSYTKPTTTEATMFGKKTLLEDWRGQPSNGVFLCFGFWMVRANRDVLSGMGFSQFRRCGGDFRRMKNA